MALLMYKGQPVVGGGESGSKNDVYSTEETVVGTWIDGKPVYRRVFSTTLGSSETTNIPLVDVNIELVSDIRGVVHGQREFPIPIQTTSGYTSLSYDIGVGAVYIATTISTMKSKPVTIIMEYTKTTDQATL